MGELLYQKWIDEERLDLPTALLHNGISGLFHDFELWLDRNGYLKETTVNPENKPLSASSSLQRWEA